jgi:hypothetical protein
MHTIVLTNEGGGGSGVVEYRIVQSYSDAYTI